MAHHGRCCADLTGGVAFITMDGTPHRINGKWDLVIAHPPCTYLSNAGAARLYPASGEIDKDRYINGLDGKLLFMAFYWYGKFGNVIAIENPTPSAVYELPKETQVIQPYQFGHPYSKRTLLWLFKLPELKPTKMVAPIMSWVSGGSKDAKGNPRKNKGETFRDSKTKSMTFKGIAEAMAEQWTEETIGKTGEHQISFL